MGKNNKLTQNLKMKGAKRKQGKHVLMFDEQDRAEFLTGFRKRKQERRRAAIEEIKTKLKEEQKRVREQRHKEYMKMLQERRQALEEVEEEEEEEDELEEVITERSECVQFDHPNHTVCVTTISSLDLSADRLLAQDEKNGDEEEKEGTTKALPKRAGNPLLSQKIKSLAASLSSLTKQKKSRRQKKRLRAKKKSDGQQSLDAENKPRPSRKPKKIRRRRNARNNHNQD
ncbi:hypothetical protein DNTS_018301 [Danionella cerebrum]|uniref:Nucleolar protein 12 n=1 Tax=Danionella cerebrum TaxID=2873325 RepID=A0A553QEP3_9TELE|nr:hypothetical protein DNTS_018301 [Danionella translucida]